MNKNLCRAELHLNTKLSDDVSVISPEEAMEFAVKNSIKAIAFTNRDNVQDFPEIAKKYQKYKGSGLKVIYGAEVFVKCEDGPKYHGLTLLCKNQDGVKELYKIISATEFDGTYKFIPINAVKQNRKNLLIGSCGNMGLLYTAFEYNYPIEEIEKIALFYNYFEIYPTDDPEQKEINKKIYDLGRELGIPTVVTGNCHYIEKQDELCREIIRASYGHTNDDKNLYFRTTEEMLEDFFYLGEDAAYWVVIENPIMIATHITHIEEVSPIKEGFYPPKIENAYEQISEPVFSKAKEIYGENLPEPITERLDTELCHIKNNDFATYYFIAHRLVKYINGLGSYVGARSAVGSSLVAFLLGISDVNPLKAHYYCPHCHYINFEVDKADGFDLAPKDCPVCQAPLKADGHNIPYETFMGYDGSRIPDIDLTFSKQMKNAAVECLCQIFGVDRLAYAGIVRKLTNRHAEMVCFDAYEYETGNSLSKDEREYIIDNNKLCGVKSCDSEHPGGIMILPERMSFEDFTPLRRIDRVNCIDTVTHLDFHDLHNTILKLDVLDYVTIDLLELLEEYTGANIMDIDYNDPVILKIFKEVDTLAIPEFSSGFMRNMLWETSPNNFNDLVKIMGLSHGTGTWLNNGEELLKEGRTLSQLPANRDDVFLKLVECGVDRKDAFKIAECVRKGKLGDENDTTLKYISIMQNAGVEKWYIDSLKKIRYMFNKAHAVSYVLNALRCAWFKHNYPAEYYAAYLTCFFDREREMSEQETRDFKEIVDECAKRGIKLIVRPRR